MQIDPPLPFSFLASAISSGNVKDLYPKFSSPSPLSHLNQIGQSEKDFIKIKMLTMFVCVNLLWKFLGLASEFLLLLFAIALT